MILGCNPGIIGEKQKNIIPYQDKSTRTYLCKDFRYKQPHSTVSQVKNPRQVIRACVKVRVMTGTYPLQVRKEKMKRADSATCPLCSSEDEDTEHFIERCPILHSTRNAYSGRLQALLPNPLYTSLTQAILDTRTLQKTHTEIENTAELEAVLRDPLPYI